MLAWEETGRNICANKTVKSVYFVWDKTHFECGVHYAAEKNCLRSFFHEISHGIHN